MTLKEIEEQKNLINTCRDRLSQEENDIEETKKVKEEVETKLQNILGKERTIKNKIRDLEQVVVAELDVKELFNELNALDSNPEIVKNSKPKFKISKYPNLLKSFKEDISFFDAIASYAKRKFDFEITITTKAQTYVLHSTYNGDELVNGIPLYMYLEVIDVDYPITNDIDVYFVFDKWIYKYLKVRLTLAQMKAYPNLETAVMNILKRREQTENV